MLGCLRGGGLSLDVTAHAYAILDSYLYGFALQEANLPFGGGERSDLAEDIGLFPAGEYPHLVEFTTSTSCGPATSSASFELGLDLILDGLDRSLDLDG